MKALIFKGKLKDPEMMKKLVSFGSTIMESEIGQKFLNFFSDMLKGFEGGHFLMKEDGSFEHFTLWQSQEDVDRVLSMDLTKKRIELLNTMTEEPLVTEIYEVMMNIPAPSHV